MPIPILMYHQIDQPPARGAPLRGLVVSPQSFAWQMKMLRLLGFKGCSMRDLEPYLTGVQSGKVVGITFDDGYQNNLLNALPILKRHGFTATCYGLASLLGGRNVWDEGQVAQKALMTRHEWLAWRDEGMDIGSHTLTHANLVDLSDEDAREEISASKRAWEAITGQEVRHFCYPYGRYSFAHVQMAREAGYFTATTTRRGRVFPGDSLWELKRIMVARATHPLQFFLKIATAYEDRRA